MPDPTPLDRAREGCPICGGSGSVCAYSRDCPCGQSPCPECARVAKLIEEAEERATERAAIRMVEAVLVKLTFHEREVVKLRLGLGDAMIYSEKEAETIFRLPKHRIRAIENRVFAKAMRAALRRAAEREGSDGHV